MLRSSFLKQIKDAFQVNPVVALLGPRQCGKTTLARSFHNSFGRSKSQIQYFDLEREDHLIRLEKPLLTLKTKSPLTIIDEVQNAPNLFRSLRVLVDESKRKSQFLILGSASRDLIRQSSESLAGRISYLELTPFQLQEVGLKKTPRLWIRGGLPLSFLASTSNKSASWRQEYISTYLERDIPSLGFKIPPRRLRKFWMMLTHYHGQIFNASEIGRSLGISDHTVKNYLDILTGTFMVRQLQPWHENLKKRQIKSPKIYFRDSGILHTLMGINKMTELQVHPKLGASWEGFIIEEVIRKLRGQSEEVYFWGIHAQSELDLLILKGTKKFGFEIKYTNTPKVTTSMKSAIDNLNLSKLTVIHAGDSSFPLSDKVEAVSYHTFLNRK